MKNTFFSKFTKLSMAFVLVCCFALSACKPEAEINENATVIGKWVDDSNCTYEITATSFKNYGEGWSAYEGNNLVINYTNDDETAGYIYIKYTKAANPDWTYSETAPDVGKWYAIAFKNLTPKSIGISGAYKADGVTATTTLEEAIDEFTIAKGYFATFTEAKKK